MCSLKIYRKNFFLFIGSCDIMGEIVNKITNFL